MRPRLLAVFVRLVVLGVALQYVDHGAKQPLEDRPCQVHAGAVGEALDRRGARPDGNSMASVKRVRSEGLGVRGE